MRIVATVSFILAFAASDAAAATPKPRLKAFSSCQDLVNYARDGALRTRGGVGVTGRAAPPAAMPIVTPPLLPQRQTGDAMTGVPAPVSAEGVAGAAPDFSGTNVQEVGVDEPDVVKTDGKRVFAVADGTLRVVDVSGDAPKSSGRSTLDGSGHQLLLRGDRVLVMATNGAPPDRRSPAARSPPAIAPVPSGRVTIVTEIDVATAPPKVVRTMELDGALRRRAPERRHRAARDRRRAGADHRRRRRDDRERVKSAGVRTLRRRARCCAAS